VGATWFLDEGDFIRVFNIQGSQWSKCFYLNLGIYVKALGDIEKPKEYDCHFRARLGDFVPDRNRFNKLLDFENEIDDASRLSELKALIQYAFDWLERYSSKNELKKAVSEKRQGFLISLSINDYL